MLTASRQQKHFICPSIYLVKLQLHLTLPSHLLNSVTNFVLFSIMTKGDLTSFVEKNTCIRKC